MAGIGKGVGSTHISICIANYINMFGNNNVLIAAMPQDEDYIALERNLQTYSLGESTFHFKGIDYYYGYRENIYTFFKGSRYSYNIFDYGDSIKEFRKECMHSDIKIVIFALNEWNINKIEDFLYICDYEFLKSCIFIYVFGDEKNRRRIERKYHIRIYKFPYIISPYYSNKEVYNFLSRKDILNIG